MKTFSKAIIHNTTLSKDKEDLMVVFMLSNIKEIFKVREQTPLTQKQGLSWVWSDLAVWRYLILSQVKHDFSRVMCNHASSSELKVNTQQQV